MTAAALLVRSSEPPADPRPWVLTALDRANLLLILRGLWVFDRPLDTEHLGKGLERLLALYPHLAGRMVAGARVELCNEGVLLETMSQPKTTVGDVCAAPDRAGRFAPVLRKARVKKGKQAPMVVRITELADGAVLGIRCTHACLDGASFFGMVRDWSRLCGGREVEPPVLDPSRVPSPLDRPKAELLARLDELGWVKPGWGSAIAALPAFPPGRLLERSPAIQLGREALAELKGRVAAAAGRDGLSTGTALAAHLTRMAVRLHGHEDGTPCQQVLVADARDRAPTLPARFVGNAALPVATPFEAGASLAEIAARAHDTLAPFVARPSPEAAEVLALSREIVRRRVIRMPYDVLGAHVPRPPVTYINNFARMPVYDLDFGEPGSPIRPVRAIPHDLPDPFLLWPAPPDQGGIEVYLTGVAARAAARQPPDGDWWTELRLG